MGRPLRLAVGQCVDHAPPSRAGPTMAVQHASCFVEGLTLQEGHLVTLQVAAEYIRMHS